MERGDTAGWELEEKRIAWLLGEPPTRGVHPNSYPVKDRIKRSKYQQVSIGAAVHLQKASQTENYAHKHCKFTQRVRFCTKSTAGMFVAREYMQNRVSGIKL